MVLFKVVLTKTLCIRILKSKVATDIPTVSVIYYASIHLTKALRELNSNTT